MKVSKNIRFSSLGALVCFLTMVLVNFLANALPLNGLTTGAVSDSYGNLFAPTGLTFAIWGVIYLLLAGYTIYQLKAGRDYLLGNLITNLNNYYIVSSIANTIWIFAWHYKIIWLTLLLMAVLLISLIRIALLLKDEHFDMKNNILIRIPFFVYFGWITVATIANVTVFLVSLGYQGYPLAPDMMTSIILVVGAVIGFIATLAYRSVFYNLVLVWAYIGILIRHLGSSGFAGQYPIVLGSLALSFVIILVALALAFRDMASRKSSRYQ
ncbi:MAG: hypothetical protein PHS94_05800 [Erysipelotrichaceae bacterium]|nr:hypothetical protein [Erysipelotrichaceae bacterium]